MGLGQLRGGGPGGPTLFACKRIAVNISHIKGGFYRVCGNLAKWPSVTLARVAEGKQPGSRARGKSIESETVG